jgi:hypothetical protein
MYNTTPRPHESTEREYGCFNRMSGAAAYLVPKIVLKPWRERSQNNKSTRNMSTDSHKVAAT